MLKFFSIIVLLNLSGCCLFPQNKHPDESHDNGPVSAPQSPIEKLSFSIKGSSTVPPGCIGMLVVQPNGDALVSSIQLKSTKSRACLNSSAFPLRLASQDGDWLSATNKETFTRTKYRLKKSVGSRCYLLQVQQNYGGRLTTNSYLLTQVRVSSNFLEASLDVISRYDEEPSSLEKSKTDDCGI